jgi:hypothetical protein
MEAIEKKEKMERENAENEKQKVKEALMVEVEKLRREKMQKDR